MAEVAKQEEIVEQRGGSTNKLLIIISSLLFLILLAGGAMAYLMLTSDDEVIEDANNAKQSHIIQKNAYNQQNGRVQDYAKVGPMVPLDKFIVNLSSDSGTRYLRTSLNLELSSEDMQSEVEQKTPMIRDFIIKILSAKSYEEISTIRGKEALKDEIVSELNKIFTDGRIENVFFTEFVIQ